MQKKLRKKWLQNSSWIFWGDRYPAFVLLPYSDQKLYTLGLILKTEDKSSFSEYSTREFRFLVEYLLNNLHKEMHVYGELFELIKKEREIIRKPSIEALNNSNTQKKTCLFKAAILRRNREETIKKFKKILSFDSRNELTLSQIASYAEKNFKHQLLGSCEKLSSLIHSIKNYNEMNKNLLQDSISCTRSTISFIQQLIYSSINYMPSGELNRTLPNGRLLNKKG